MNEPRSGEDAKNSNENNRERLIWVGKLRSLPIEHREIIDRLIEQKLGNIAIIKSIQALYPKLWAHLGGVLSEPTMIAYRRWYESKKKALAIIEEGGEIKNADLMDTITDIAEKGDINQYTLLKSITLLMVRKVKAMGGDFDTESRKLLPTYVAELRQLVELMLKVTGNLKSDQSSVVVNIVHSHLDGIYRAIHRAITIVCPQYLNQLAAEIRKQIQIYQSTIEIKENENVEKEPEREIIENE